MTAVIQRVLSASVSVGGEKVGSCDKGLFILLGVKEGDTEAETELLARKVSALRIFSDSADKMNLSVTDVNGSILVVSNFTLCADCKKGNRPSYTDAMRPDEANRLYLKFCDNLRSYGIAVETGVFGEDMKINPILDGPVTIVLDTDIWKKQ